MAYARDREQGRQIQRRNLEISLEKRQKKLTKHLEDMGDAEARARARIASAETALREAERKSVMLREVLEEARRDESAWKAELLRFSNRLPPEFDGTERDRMLQELRKLRVSVVEAEEALRPYLTPDEAQAG